MAVFVPGLELSRRFFREVVRPILTQTFPDLRYAAGLIGPGSEVLGFDSEMSVDHDWGPRLFIFLREEDTEQAEAVGELLSQRLPAMFAGYAVAFFTTVNSKNQAMGRAYTGPVQHHVILTGVRDFVRVQIGYDLAQPLEVADWLSIPSHALGELVGGEVYQDEVGEMTAVRKEFAWYPHDVWLYLLAAGWQRIGQEEHLMPRAGSVGDELGSALIGSRLVRDIMNLCFLMERRYAPYAKWFGTAFKGLRAAPELMPLLSRAQQAGGWHERAEALARAYEVLARLQNELDVGVTLTATVSSFHDRPFPVIHGEVYAQALVERITDPAVRRIAAQGLIGNISQWNDNTDMEGVAREKIRQMYA
jgi:hypothetical protein